MFFNVRVPTRYAKWFAKFKKGTFIFIPNVKETYGRDAEYTEDGRDERIGATEYAEGNGTRKRGGKAERIT